MDESSPSYIAFDGSQRLAAGALHKVVRQVKRTSDAHPLARILVFKVATSELVDFDLRGSVEQVLHRLGESAPVAAAPAEPVAAERPAPTGPGRPRLGVVAREVTLLPRHWEWLSSQPGGASVALRKLVEQAKKAGLSSDRVRQAQTASYRFMSAMAGNLDGFEEAARALFAADRARFEVLMAPWPEDVCSHLREISIAAFEPLAEQETQHA